MVEANDGIVATAGIVEGLVAADVRNRTVLVSAVVALVVGAVSSAGARYAEAAFQRDAALQAVSEELAELASSPDAEFQELVEAYVAKGLSPGLARQVAGELMARDPLAAHMEAELDVDDGDFVPPLLVATMVGISYAIGAVLPILITLIVPTSTRVLTTLIAVSIALVITSYVGARVGRTRPLSTILRALSIGVSTLLLALLVGLAFD